MFHRQRLINVVANGPSGKMIRINGPFRGKNTINSYGCMRYSIASSIFLKNEPPCQDVPTTANDFFSKKNLRLKKRNQIILLSSMTSLKTLHI